jgi:hypothetical protein
MPFEIHETTISENADATVVHLFVSDKQRHEIGANFHLDLRITLPRYEATPLLAQVQREALKAAGTVLTPILDALALDIERANKKERLLDPKPRL